MGNRRDELDELYEFSPEEIEEAEEEEPPEGWERAFDSEEEEYAYLSDFYYKTLAALQQIKPRLMDLERVYGKKPIPVGDGSFTSFGTPFRIVEGEEDGTQPDQGSGGRAGASDVGVPAGQPRLHFPRGDGGS
jgi:hypothetical protein